MPGQSQSNQTENKTTTTQPWAPAQPALQGLLARISGQIGNTDLTAAETGAFNALAGSAATGNPYATRVGGIADALLAGGADRTPMINQAYDRYVAALEPTARGDYLDPSKNPFFAGTTGAISDDVVKRLTGMYAAAGHAPSGAGSIPLAVAEGVAKGTAPVFASAWDSERGRALDATKNLLAAAASTGGLLSQFDQQRFGNMQAGIGAAGSAMNFELDPYNRMLAIEAARRAIPLDQLQRLAGMTVPIAGLGGTSNTTGTTTTTQQQDPTQAIVGGLLGGIGMLSGNPMMAMSGLRTAVGQPLNLAPPVRGLDQQMLDYYASRR
jgi:hypothetical protein